VVATDLLSGEPVVLEDGDLRRNVLASAAIPGLFPAVEIDGRTLADGGLAAQVPVLEAIALGAASVVVLDTGYPCALSELPRGLIPNVVHAASLVLRHQSTASLRMIGTQATVLYLPSPCPLGVPPWDFTKSGALIEKGHRFSSRFLEGLHALEPGVHGHPHVHEGGQCEKTAPRPRRAAVMEPATGPAATEDVLR
jgi:NTE family protein